MTNFDVRKFDVADIRDMIKGKLYKKEYIIDKTGAKTVELIGTAFFADEETIFGVVNKDYAEAEIAWYNSQSLNINDMPCKVPAIWKAISDSDDMINSNYGWCIFSKENGSQYDNTLLELQKSPDSRRAIMIYTRPSMWTDYNKKGMNDFMCTNTVQYLIRDNKVHAIVNQRSMDVLFGYKNDRYWANYVLNKLASDLDLPAGDIIWQTGSLHVYERHFNLISYNDRQLGLEGV